MIQVHAVIQAGGLGQRIHDAAGELPKPLLPVGGVAMIDRLLAQILAAGVRNVTVVLGQNGQRIRTHLLEYTRDLPTDLRLDFFVESTGLGNAGALGEINAGSRPVLLCFADLVTDLNFHALLAIHEERQCNVTLASHYEYHQLSLGELVVDGDRVRVYNEKPRKRFLICSGIALFDPASMAVARNSVRPYGLSELVNAVMAAGYTVKHWLHEAYWIDVNTPALLKRARDDSLARQRLSSRDDVPHSTIERLR